MKIPGHPMPPGELPGAGPGRHDVAASRPVPGSGPLRLEVVQADDRTVTLAGPGDLRLKAPQPDPPLLPGARLTARLQRRGNRLLLEIRTHPEIGFLRRRLRELPPPPGMQSREALAALAWAARLAGALPREVAEGLRDLLSRLPRIEEVATAEGLRGALRDGGTSLESRIAAALLGSATGVAAGPAPLDASLDLALRRLAVVLRAWAGLRGPGVRTAAADAGIADAPPADPLTRMLAPEELERLPDALQARLRALAGQADAGGRRGDHPGQALAPALGRLLLDAVETLLARQLQRQLHHAEQGEKGLDEWQVELPLRGEAAVEPLVMRFRREGRHCKDDGSDAEVVWRVRLELRPPRLGRLVADISLAADQRVEIHFLTPSETAHRLLETALPRLGERLEALGLAPRALSVRRGTPPASEAPPACSLLDEHA